MTSDERKEIVQIELEPSERHKRGARRQQEGEQTPRAKRSTKKGRRVRTARKTRGRAKTVGGR